MHSIRRSLVGLSLLGVILLAGVPSPAQAASSNGPYYAEPAWDQKLPAAMRFIVLTDWFNEAVLDRETGLVWEKSTASEQRTWSDASYTCLQKTVGDRRGWRLPSIPELTSLMAYSVFPLPNGHPFNMTPGSYWWSATTVSGNPADAYYVTQVGGVSTASKTGTSGAWCVRGGMNADAY